MCHCQLSSCSLCHCMVPLADPRISQCLMNLPVSLQKLAITLHSAFCLQCFDTVGQVSGRASGLWKLSDGVLVWLSVWSEVKVVCIWSSWYHCYPKTHHLLPHLNPDQFYPVPFWYQLTQVVLEKRPLDGFSAVVVTQKSKLQLAETMWSVQVRLHSDDISARQFVHNLKTVLFVWAYLSKAHLRTLIQKLSLKWTYLLTSFSVIHLVHAHQAVTYQ